MPRRTQPRCGLAEPPYVSLHFTSHRIDPVVLGMSADELDLYRLEPINDANNQPKLVAADVEDHSVVGDKINRRAKPASDVGRPGPVGFGDGLIPSPEGGLGLGVPLPKQLERPQRND